MEAKREERGKKEIKNEGDMRMKKIYKKKENIEGVLTSVNHL